MPHRFRCNAPLPAGYQTSHAIRGVVFLLLVLLGPLEAWSQTNPRNTRQLRRAIDQVLDVDAFENATWSLLVVDLNSGRTLYQRNAQKSFIPASNTKLYTTAAALDQLGPDYVYETPLYADSPVVDGVLQGNLIVRGSGDPVIGGRFNDGDITEAFRDWADALKAAGITRIAGDLIGDDDFFDDQALGFGWNWDDETFWYAAETGALSLNDNNVDLTIAGQTPGGPASITWEPLNTSYVTVVNQSRTVHPDSSLDEGYVRPRGTNTLLISSEVPAGRADLESLTITNATLFFMHVLRETLLREGISVAGAPVDVDDLSIKPNYDAPQMRRLATHTSPPLRDIVEVLNKQSQNLYAEQVLKTLGAVLPADSTESEPGSAWMGIDAAMRTYARAGVDTSRIQLRDGSGLARHNLVTAEMTNALLRYMWHHPDSSTQQAFYHSLPIGGVDGTLRWRYPDETDPARANVRAKTGTVSNASTLSGYVRTARGTPLAFVIMANHYTVPTREVRNAQDAIVSLLARYQR